VRRVIVSGIGITSPNGLTLAGFWRSLLDGSDVFSETTTLPASGIRVGAINPSVSFQDIPLPSLSPCDRNAILALSATRSALKDAGLDSPFPHPERVAVVIGNGAGGLCSIEEQYERLFKQNRKTHPFTIVRAMLSSSASWISLAYGAKGPCFVMASACASATQAIGTANHLVRSGLVDIAITGGTEAPLSMGTILAWDSMKVMSRGKCRPFSKNREGMMISEGSGILILEAEAHARARGVTPSIEVAGFASNADATDIVAPSVDGMARAMQSALTDAGLAPGEISYINAHGTGTLANDVTEAGALRQVFGAGKVPPLSSTKGATGHALGAAGAIEAVATVMAMREGVAPPTANFDEVDPECDIDVIPNLARSMPIETALSNSFAFGGLNASLALRRFA
jgi:nodulation protein E